MPTRITIHSSESSLHGPPSSDREEEYLSQASNIKPSDSVSQSPTMRAFPIKVHERDENNNDLWSKGYETSELPQPLVTRQKEPATSIPDERVVHRRRTCSAFSEEKKPTDTKRSATERLKRRNRTQRRQTPPPARPHKVPEMKPERENVHEVLWDLNRTRDVTIHLELDFTQDLEPDLEKFGRLNRLGNFREVKILDPKSCDSIGRHLD